MEQENAKFIKEQAVADVHLELDEQILALQYLLDQNTQYEDVSKNVIVEVAKDLQNTIDKAQAMGIDTNIYEEWAKL